MSWADAGTIGPWADAALGRLHGTTMVSKFGRNEGIDIATTPEDIWTAGGVYAGFSAGAETLSVVSSSVADTAAGTGARTVRIDGLDADFLEISETVTLNGTTPVLTTQAFSRAQRARVMSAGSGGVNAGTVTFSQSTSGDVHGSIPVDRNQTHIAAYTVPDNRRGVIVALRWTLQRESGGSIDREAQVDVLVRSYDPDTGLYTPLQSKQPLALSSRDGIDAILPGGISVGPRTDIVCRCFSVTNNTSLICAAFDVALIDA